jgi:hypothetical protein
MALNLASPGIIVREIDLTVGRATANSDKIGGIVAPFAQGPVEIPTIIESENELIKTFGQPYTIDKHYEHWLSCSSYLAYGGSLRIIRSDDAQLKNAFVGTASSIKIKSAEHYIELGYDINPITDVVFASRNPGSWANGIRVGIIDSKADQILGVTTSSTLQVGFGVTQSINSVLSGAGTTSVLDGFLRGIITEVAASTISVKVLSHVSAAGTVSIKDYQPNGIYQFSTGAAGDSTGLHIKDNSNIGIATGLAVTSNLDWFDQQTIGVSTTSDTRIFWNTLSNRPGTSEYAAARGSRFDEVHVVVIDSVGTITGNAGNILEKHLGLSKASDAQFSVGSPSYWRKYLVNSSDYIFGGSQPAGITSTSFKNLSTSNDNVLTSDFGWDQEADGITFGASGSITSSLGGGKNYLGGDQLTTGELTATLGALSSGYDLFENTDSFKVDFLLMGSSNYDIEGARALASKIISVAELRKDAIAFISPYRGAALTDTNVQTSVTVRAPEDITNNVLTFYSALPSSSYAVFDSGYKYTYDRFSDTFRYIPLNGDIAGICARNDINNFPWFSPAGTARGSVLNAVKLAYNPSKTQRDRLYSERINSIIFSPGSGIILFGDKTGFAKASAFDRINVRRLFIFLEEAISNAARDQLFEFNDSLTRTNFVNTIEPFLRDVQAKRGIFDYVVVCDETNNTAAVIDNNEFIADIYIKPARSINFIGLNFVATKTGVDFEEVIGNF